jgi:hypothetical protein
LSALVLAGIACGSCRSTRIAPERVASQAEIDAFSDMVDQLTRFGRHGAIDPAKERDPGR